MTQKIAGKNINQWIEAFALMQDLIATKEVCWLNPHIKPIDQAMSTISLKIDDVMEAERRLQRFAPYLASVFPETAVSNGIIESELKEIPAMKQLLNHKYGEPLEGNLMLKCDSHLPISGSIKARGGIYEVLKHAEDLLLQHNMISKHDDYSIIAHDSFKQFFSNHSIVVGSTGNLGLSIGMMSAKLGFCVTVHMSADAKQWKKDLLRQRGVLVVEHSSDYSEAVKEGRHQSDADPSSYFVDDENSVDLFLGYAVAARRLKKQLDDMEIVVDYDHPLRVYLPCGVGGGPGGVAFGLKLVFGDCVSCYFAEPTHSPSMLIGLMTGEHNNISVQDFGIDNKTAADGLAVGRPSGFVGKTMKHLISGVYTVEDSMLYELLADLADSENIFLEPSALAGLYGPIQTREADRSRLRNTTHIAWATGGSMVPKDVMAADYQLGAKNRSL